MFLKDKENPFAAPWPPVQPEGIHPTKPERAAETPGAAHRAAPSRISPLGVAPHLNVHFQPLGTELFFLQQ